MSNKLIPEGLMGEQYSDDVAFVIKPEEVLGEVKSKYQTSTIIKNGTFGRMVFQDGLIYIADTGNEPIYEMYTHIPMLTGKPKKKVLLIGAGDGFGIGRFLEYPSLEKIVAIDIDKDFVDLAKKIYPENAKNFEDPRVEMVFEDGAEYIKNTSEEFDFIVVTVGDPFTISQTMFNKGFIEECHKHLSDYGILCMDGYMPFYTHKDSLNYWDIFALISEQFPITRMCYSTSPLMPGGLCTFVMGSKVDDPMNEPRHELPSKTLWYNYDIHKSSFILPQFVKEKLEGIKGFNQ